MGKLLSKFRKQPTTLEQLKTIEDGLKKIEDYRRNTERQQKRLVANVIICSSALYILSCVIVFVWYLPEYMLVRLGLLIPLILVPVIIYWLKQLISWYFQSKMVKANEDYADLQRKKKEIIDSVMETETFNKAKEILSKYAPDQLEKKLQERITSPVSLNVKTSMIDTHLRKRQGQVANTSMASTTVSKYQPPPNAVPVSNNPIRSWGRQEDLLGERLRNPSQGPVQPPPAPIFSRERGLLDKIVEYIIGDGPCYRLALICQYCGGHNGMALQEEFPYTAYTCCYCLHYNSARTKRLMAPTLEAPVAFQKPLAVQASQFNPVQVENLLEEPSTNPGPSASRIQPKTEEPNENLEKTIDDQLNELFTNARKLQSKSKPKKAEERSSEEVFPKPVPFDQFIAQLDLSYVAGADVHTAETDELLGDRERVTPGLKLQGSSDNASQDTDFQENGIQLIEDREENEHAEVFQIPSQNLKLNAEQNNVKGIMPLSEDLDKIEEELIHTTDFGSSDSEYKDERNYNID